MKNIKSQSLVLIALFSALVPGVAAAETVVRTGTSVSVAVDQVVENDFYAAGGSVTHSGEVREDMYVFSGSVTVNGRVGRDLTVLGGTVGVHGPIGDDLRVVGGETVIADEVKGDVFVLGGQLRVLSTGKVGGNVYFYGGEAEIEGAVKGVVMGQAESFNINSAVGGVDVVGALTLSSAAAVKGDVSYESSRELVRAQNASVQGEIVRGASSNTMDEGGGNDFGLVALVAWFFTSLCVYLLLRGRLEQLWSVMRREPVQSSIFGLVTLFAGPILGFILLITVLGSWLGLLMFLALAFALVVGFILLPIMVGRFAVSFFKQWNKLDYVTVAVGLALTAVLANLAWLGGLAIFVALVMTIGALVLAVYRKIKDLV